MEAGIAILETDIVKKSGRIVGGSPVFL